MSVVISFLLVMFSAWFDAQGFHHATQAWQANGQFLLKQGAYSLLCFFVGVSIYIYSVRFITITGVTSSTLQTLLWFVATIVGVAFLSGEFQKWNPIQYVALVAVLFGMSVLMATENA